MPHLPLRGACATLLALLLLPGLAAHGRSDSTDPEQGPAFPALPENALGAELDAGLADRFQSLQPNPARLVRPRTRYRPHPWPLAVNYEFPLWSGISLGAPISFESRGEPAVQVGGRLHVFRATTGPDGAPPAAVTDLAATADGNDVTLTWTASGEDGSSGATWANVVFYDDEPIDHANYESAESFELDCPPVAGGTTQTCVLADLGYSTEYFFVVRTFDFRHNALGISNVTTATTAAPPRIELGPPALALPLLTGETATGAFWIRNDGDTDLTFEITEDATWLRVSPLTGRVPPGESLEIACEVDASRQCAPLVEALEITSSDPSVYPTSLYFVVGNVTVAPEVAAPSNPLDFGTVTRFVMATEDLSVENVGCEELVVNELSIRGSGFLLGSTSGFTVAPGGRHRVTVAFHTSRPGIHRGTLTIDSNDPEHPQYAVLLTADAGEGGPQLAVPRHLLLGNVPNPFSGRTSFRFTIAQPGHVELRVHDVQGRVVRILDAGHRSAGLHEVPWRGRDERGQGVASGLYFYRLYLDGVPTGDIRRAVLVN